MEKKNKLDSGFSIVNIILAESHFARVPQLNLGKEAKNKFNINTGVAVDGNDILVEETVTVSAEYRGEKQFEIYVKMVGTFKCIGETKIKDYNAFGKVNGAAILFPYIREHITGLSVKGGIGPIILPPVNFTKMKESKK